LLGEFAPQAVGYQSSIGIKSSEITSNFACQYRKDVEKLVKNGKLIAEHKEIVAINQAAIKQCESCRDFSLVYQNISILKTPIFSLEDAHWSCTIKVDTDRDRPASAARKIKFLKL